MKTSLGVILALCLAGLQFVAVSIVVLSSYVTSEHALLTHARNLLSDAGTNTIEHSKGFLEPAKGAAELATRLAENRIVASDNFNLLEKFLFQQLQVTPQFAGLYYGDKAGNFVYVKKDEAPGPFRSKIISHPAGNRLTELLWRDDDYAVLETEIDEADFYDPRTRLWYQDAQVALETIWTDPYIFFTSQQPGITVASPVFADDGSLQGVVGVDIEIDSISSFLSHLKIGETGKALILNKNGDVIAHPNQDLLKKRKDDGTFRFSKIGDIDDPLARAAFEGLNTVKLGETKQEVTSGFVFEGARYVSTTMPVMSDELPWTIAMWAPEADFTGEIRRNRTQNIWIAAVIAFLSGVTGLGLAKFIHKPVRAFAVRSALISQGEISENEPAPATYRELEKVNDTLVHEIAQRKKTEHEYGRTFDLASRAMVQIDSQTGQFLRANAVFSDMLGYSVEEILKRTVCDISLLGDHESALDFVEKPYPAMSRNQEKQLLRKNGDTVWVSTNTILIRDARGNPLHAVVTMDDLTESRSKEVEIQTLNRDLIHSSRVNTMGYMATSLAHELNQPLTAITQNMDAAILSLRQNLDDPQIKKILEETDQQAHRAGEIIRALREFVLKGEVDKSYYEFGEILRQSLQLVHGEAKLHGTTIETSYDDLPPVFGSRIQVAQVLVNLMRNSIEAIAQSNTNFRLVTVSAQKTARGLMICVEDTGPGFQGDFDPFGKFETNKQNGMGLGLSICKTIVEAHGGSLWYENEDRKPRFCFTLMAEDASCEAKQSRIELEPMPDAAT